MSLIASSHITLVLGLGVTGLSVARYLAAKGKTFWLADSALSSDRQAQIAQDFPGARLLVGAWDYKDWQGVDEIVLSPGIPREQAAVAAAIADGIPVVGDIDLFTREAQAPIVAITGSNGKTTVTHLLGEMARNAGVAVRVGGNIGTPALDLLDASAELYVLELSSFQLESTRHLKALAATVLNVTPDHMDRYRNLQAYHLAKQRIYFGVTHAVVNRDDPLTQPPLAQGARVAQFGLGEPDLKDFGMRQHDGETWLAKGLRPLIRTDDIKMHGVHNRLNAMAALALGEAAGLPEAAMLETLRHFTGLPHRCQWVAECRGVAFINDSKATNIGATQAALRGLSGVVSGTGKNLILIAGGDGKGADFSTLKADLLAHVKMLVTLGRDGEVIADLGRGTMPVRVCDSLSDAVSVAAAWAVPGDKVLLSPACASLDMFKNYEDRGRQFQQLAEALCSPST